MNLVIDCSFVMSSVLPGELEVKVEKIYDQISNKVYRIYAPAIFYLECNNALISSLERKRINKNDYEEYLQTLYQLPVIVDRFCSNSESVHAIGRIANKYNLTSYDAAYLELALRIEAKIATLDKFLSQSCKTAGIESIV